MVTELDVLLMMGAYFGGFVLISYLIGKGLSYGKNHIASEKESAKYEDGSIGALIEKDTLAIDVESDSLRRTL